MIRRKRWLSVLCAMAVILTSLGGWWTEYSVGAAATYWVYVEDYYQGSSYTTYSLSYSSNSPVTLESFFNGQQGIDKTPGKIHTGMVLTSYSSGSVTPLENGAGRAVLSRYFASADCVVTYTDRVGKGPRQGNILGTTNKTVPCGQTIKGTDIDTSYTGFIYASSTTNNSCQYTAQIYREFDPVTTTVYYDYQGGVGGSVSSEEFYYGSTIQLTNNTSTKKYTIELHSAADEGSSVAKTVEAFSVFRGWSDREGGTVVYTDGASLGTVSGTQHSSKTLYAVWEDKDVTLPVPEERAGYEFLGWSTNPDAVTGDTSVTATSGMELYPIWSAEEKIWTAEYYIENLNGEYELVDSEGYGGSVDSTASLDINKEKDRYTGFTLNEDESILTGTVPAEGELVLKAYYSRNSYSVKYDTNGGEKTGGDEGWTAEKKFDEEITLLSPNIKRTGYCFSGWSEAPEGGEIIFEAGADFTVPAQDVTLYANWIPISYEVAFDGNGAAGTADAAGNIAAEYDHEIILPECGYTRTGYSFAGWNTKADGSGSLYGAGARVKNLLATQGTVTLYAQWKVRIYHVSYHTNHTEAMLISNVNAIPDTEYQYGDEVVARDAVYKALGYQMKGWNTKADGTGISIALGEKISDKIECNDDIALYAVWERDIDTAFQIELYMVSEDNTQSQIGRLTLSGITEEKICDAVKRIYEEELEGEPLSFFYEGYEVVNMEAMEKTIAGDGSTSIMLQLKERSCQLSFRYFADGQEKQIEQVELAYMEPYNLPEKIGEQAGIARYITAKQEGYSPGEEIRPRRNMVLYLQQAIRLEGNSEQFEDRTEYVIRGKNFALPEIIKNGYQFLGWYTQDNEYIGMVGQLMQRVMVDNTLAARWSDPLHYEIRFDIDEDKIKILENKVTEYQYGTVVYLPTKEQVVVADGYIFLGWYEDGDESKTLITSIDAASFGDKKIKALLIKASDDGSDSDGTQGGNGGNAADGTGSGNSQGGNDSNGGQSSADGSEGNSGQNGENGTGGTGSEDNQAGDGNSGQGGADGSDGNSGENGDNNISGAGSENGQDGNLEEKPDAGNNLDSLKQYGTQDSDIKLEKFWKNKLRYKMVKGKNGTVLLKVINCRKSLKKVKIPASVKRNGTIYKVTRIGKKAFYKKNKIRSVVIGKNVKRIGKLSLAKMKKLRRVTLGKSVKTIRRKAFLKDASLRKLIIRTKKLSRVAKNAFRQTRPKKGISYPRGKKRIYSVYFPG